MSDCIHSSIPRSAAELNRSSIAAAAPGEVVLILGGGAVQCPDCGEWIDLQPTNLLTSEANLHTGDNAHVPPTAPRSIRERLCIRSRRRG